MLKRKDASKTRRASAVLGVHDQDGTERNAVLQRIYIKTQRCEQFKEKRAFRQERTWTYVTGETHSFDDEMRRIYAF